MKDINRIHITGVYGVGKTVFANELSKILDIDLYHLDDIKYKRKYDEERTIEERKQIVKNISRKKKWITEGVWTSYARDLFEKADLVIFLEEREFILYKRIIFRYIKKILEGNKNKAKLFVFIRAIYRYFRKPENFTHLETYQECIEKYSRGNVIKINNKREAKELLKKISKKGL